MEPGDDGGDCRLCGATTTLIGHGHSVYGTVCEDCSAVFVMPSIDVYGGDNIPRARSYAESAMETFADDDADDFPLEMDLQHIHASLGGDKADLYPDDIDV